MSIKTVIKRHQLTVSLSRPVAKTVTGGYATEGTPTVYNDFKAAVQPLTPKEIRNLPPGQNAMAWRNFWSFDTRGIQIKDKITAPDGVVYTIQNSIYWAEGGFWQAQGSKVSDRT